MVKSPAGRRDDHRGRRTDVMISNPRASRALGISVVHQHPVTFPDLTVAENIMLVGACATQAHPAAGLGQRPPARSGEALDRLDVHLDISAEVAAAGSRPAAARDRQQRWTPAPGCWCSDEPTAALSTARWTG
ncbi:hypothetical protein HBB16_03880 [Pseudonocardia sp. MCCB 268]|nr:hypothetical protein [Pseudonocardia cytotoxica]